MATLQAQLDSIVQRAKTLQGFSHSQFLPKPVLTDTDVAELIQSIETRFRESAAFGIPDWAKPLEPFLIDWHQIMLDKGVSEIQQVMDTGRFDQLYHFADSRVLQEFGAQLCQNVLFIERLERIARTLTTMAEAGRFTMRVRPEWFVFDGNRFWCQWQTMAQQSIPPTETMLADFDLGWMHPSLRSREIPKNFDCMAATTYTFVSLLLHTLTQMPPPADMSAFHTQIDRFRVYNPAMSQMYRPFFNSMLMPGLQAPVVTPTEAFKQFHAVLKDVLRREQAPYIPMQLSWKGDSLYGKNKRLNENEDQIVSIPGLADTHALIGVADGVSTAEIGSGWVAAAVIKLTIDRNAAEWRERLNTLPDPGLYMEEWEKQADDLLRTIFKAVHQAVADEISTRCTSRGMRIEGREKGTRLMSFAASLQAPPSGVAMSSTLVLALIQGNRGRIAHWGDSRAYLVTPTALIRLTEDHNRVLELMVKKETPFQLSPSGGSELVRVVGRGTVLRDGKGFESIPFEKQPLTVTGITLLQDDLLLLCSDGLPGSMSPGIEAEKEAKLHAVIMAKKDAGLRDLAWHLVHFADEDMGNDNISLVILSPQSNNAEKQAAGLPKKGRYNG
jgi:serine/threonine protein phosphatase PrpC